MITLFRKRRLARKIRNARKLQNSKSIRLHAYTLLISMFVTEKSFALYPQAADYIGKVLGYKAQTLLRIMGDTSYPVTWKFFLFLTPQPDPNARGGVVRPSLQSMKELYGLREGDNVPKGNITFFNANKVEGKENAICLYHIADPEEAAQTLKDAALRFVLNQIPDEFTPDDI
ncbi:MAG: hypothetical protein AAFO96_03910 [Bacteroidota bacterium]